MRGPRSGSSYKALLRDLGVEIAHGGRRASLGCRASSRTHRFVVCVRNEGYEASLERNKIYAVLPDDDAEREGDVRVIDESGEDYLFSADRIDAIDPPL